jgi:hypothetical protein
MREVSGSIPDVSISFFTFCNYEQQIYAALAEVPMTPSL